METTAVDNPQVQTENHNSCTLQPDFPAFHRLGNQRWISAIALFELHPAGLWEELLLTGIAPAVWHNSRVQPLGLGSFFTSQGGGKAGEVQEEVPWKGRAHLRFPLHTAECSPCVRLGRSNMSMAGTSPPLPLFGPWFIPNYHRGSTKLNRKKRKKHTTKPLTFSRP